MTNKTKKRLSNAWFWIKHLSLAGILIWAAYYFLYGAMPSFDMRETKNAAAQGLSQFYESFRNRVNDKDLDRDKYVINLGKQTFPLEDALQQRGLVVKPSPVNWKVKYNLVVLTVVTRLKGSSLAMRTMKTLNSFGT